MNFRNKLIIQTLKTRKISNIHDKYKFFSLYVRLQDVKDEFDDFQEGSRELEAELEAQLEQYEKRVKELISTRSALEEENETLKVNGNILITSSVLD